MPSIADHTCATAILSHSRSGSHSLASASLSQPHSKSQPQPQQQRQRGLDVDGRIQCTNSEVADEHEWQCE